LKNKIGILLLIVTLTTVAFMVWVFKSANTSKAEIFVKTGDNSDSLYLNLIKSGGLKKSWTFNIVKSIMEMDKIYSGKYQITEGMNNRALFNMFKYGNQVEVKIRLGNNVFPYEIFGALGRKFESDSVSFENAVYNANKLKALSLDSASAIALFWADTYQFPWTISADKVVDYFINDQQKFWNSERFNKLVKTGLHSTKEVYILASIVEKEVMKADEMPIIAGVYINRLKIGMPLQADPTLKYASGIKFMRRVTGILDIESPYNTYKNTGFPPGPIGLATKKGVDAVLNFLEHDYLYFCAKEDFSGRHYFTNSYTEHLKNAKLYRAALDAKGVK